MLHDEKWRGGVGVQRVSLLLLEFGRKRALPLIMPRGYCVWPFWIPVYMCFKINIDFLPFGLFLSGVSSLLMIGIIVAVMNVLIKRKFCHATWWGKHEPFQLETSGLRMWRAECEIVKKRKKKRMKRKEKRRRRKDGVQDKGKSSQDSYHLLLSNTL